jgi:hypothetical protein
LGAADAGFSQRQVWPPPQSYEGRGADESVVVDFGGVFGDGAEILDVEVGGVRGGCPAGLVDRVFGGHFKIWVGVLGQRREDLKEVIFCRGESVR